MQAQSFIFFLLMLIVLPLMVLSANHQVFFILIGTVLLLASIRNIHACLLTGSSISKDADEAEKDMQDLMDIDLQKFGMGTKIAKNLIIILFFIYCIFFAFTLWLKMFILVLILYYACDIRITLLGGSHPVIKPSGLFLIIVNICSIGVILIIGGNKFFSPLF